jgi:hypothetical protein
MYSWNIEKERSGLENALRSENLEFSGAFMVVQDQTMVSKLETICPCSSLESVFLALKMAI